MAEPLPFTACRLALSGNLRGCGQAIGGVVAIFCARFARVPPPITNPGSATAINIITLYYVIYYCHISTEPPGQPITLRLEGVGATRIQITWESPLTVDFPISRYEVIARATENPDIIIRNMSTPNNSTFVNVIDLIPGTAYNFTVVAVIEAGEVVARGVESASLDDIITGFTGKHWTNWLNITACM